ncbi:MXAN_6577-like cysteine-rich protein [Nannocystis bainbridge]|uniref:MXAN_6577-like cysteine-rich protein n=1 Tax=Nannocystis bainbridge TaxID=2995303 RepID=A0ABT5DRU4_9BACT|nr:MXAN_6577-like cysteine-rich protein [Nannocystis bainbridge]MDC0716377.1 MXAN_6577-like cysteine-rich protein [Nannocystis bainbridge]
MPVRVRPSLVLVLLCACPSAAGTTTEDTVASTGSGGAATGEPTSTGPDAPTTAGGCPAPLAECDGACVDVAHDPAHCGGCDSPCDAGLACLEGQCGVACGPGTATCDGACVDLEVDPSHCGACDRACDPGVACVAATCVPGCAPEQALCGEACVDPGNDEAHCGGCDTACPSGQPCVYGQCVGVGLHHLLISGQSLSTGSGSVVVSVEQPFANVSFNTGVRAGGVGLTGFIPLIETWNGGEGETIASGAANLVSQLEQDRGGSHKILASAHGVGGQPYGALKKGTAPYANGVAQVTAGVALAAMAGEAYAVRAVAIVHGESDHLGGNLAYAEDLLAWQSDYEADVKAITAQPYPVPMFLCQMSSWTMYGSSVSRIPGEQLAAARARPDRIFVVGPKYMLPYVDGVHLTGEGSRWLGEYYAKAYRRVLVEGLPWRPLAPRSITREGAVVTVEFEVLTPPLVLDELLVSNPGNYGFEFTDSSGAPPAIAAVALAGPTTVQLTLAAEPVGGNQRVRYAATGVPGVSAGPTTGARGNLRDSDATVSRHGYSLFNWAVHFDEPVQ